MALPYPITSHAGRVVDLTGGKLDRFENFVIRKTSNVVSFFRTYNILNKLSERELDDIGLKKADVFKVAICALKGETIQRA